MFIITTLKVSYEYCPFSAIKRCKSTDHTSTDHKVDVHCATCYNLQENKTKIAYM